MGGSVDLIASFSQRLATCVQRKRIRVDHGILAGLDELSSSSSEMTGDIVTSPASPNSRLDFMLIGEAPQQSATPFPCAMPC